MADNEIKRQREEHLDDTSGPAKDDAPAAAPAAPATSTKKKSDAGAGDQKQ